MKGTSFLLGVLLIIGWHEMLHAASVHHAFSDSSAEQVLNTLNLENCDPLAVRLACLKRKYRTFDGTCNNLCNTTLGAANQPHRRFEGLPGDGTAYQQPNNQPRLFSADGNGQTFFLPNARKVSFKVFQANNVTASFTHIVMTWGQFLDHDLTLTELSPIPEGVSCGTNLDPCPDPPADPECISIKIASGNQLLGSPESQCIPFSRSLREGNEQVNLLTSYIDASQIYGSDLETANDLRNFNARIGLLSVEPFVNSNGRSILPRAEEGEECRSEDPENKFCFRAGDIRVNENQALMAMHAIWVREHNRIANILHVLNPTWNDEKLFQQARKIVAAMTQHITYNEWLEVLFNETIRENAGVKLEPDGQFFNDYDPAQAVSMTNVFSTSALRFGHTLIRETFALDNGTRPVSELPRIRVDFFKPEALFDEEAIGGFNPYGAIFNGLVLDRAFRFDANIANSVRELLIIEGEIHADLGALNIQRGRDHGLPGYIEFSKICGGPVASGTNFNQLTNIPFAQRVRLAGVYRVVEDIDVFPGMMSENIEPGTELGLTTGCVLLRQFRDLRFGDRFWYERDDPCTAFTMEQLTEIRKATLARVICDNTDDVSRIQGKVFRRRTGGNGDNPVVLCDSLPFVNLNVFKEDAGAAMEGSEGAGGEKGGGWSPSVGA